MVMASLLPRPGMFLRSVEGFCTSFCLQVVRVLDCAETHAPGITHLACKRWGLDDAGQPFDDGHHNESYYTARFRPVGQQAIPNRMQIIARHHAIARFKIVTAPVFLVTGVQWLMKVANEMDKKG